MDDEDFLAAVEADNKSVSEEPVKVEVVEPETVPEPTPEPVAEPSTAEPEALELTTDQIIPPKPDAADGRLSALLDERDRRKAAEAERDALRAKQAQAQPVQMPDPYEDPEGFAAAQQAQVGQALYQTNLRWSERIASIQHGAETVNAAKDWGFAKCDADPYFNAKVAASDDPIGFVVSEYKREEIASKVDLSEYEQFQAWKAAQGQIAQGGQPPPPTQPTAIPKPSLASAPSAGGILTDPEPSEDDIFAGAIPKR